MYYVVFRGYTPPYQKFDTKQKARVFLKECIQEDLNGRKGLTKIRHSADHYETKIGGRQGIHTYSEGWVKEG